MERNEISLHEVNIYKTFLGAPKKWFTNQEVAALAGVAGRTARMHTKRLASIGVLDQAELFPGHRYRFSEKAAKRDAGYLNRLNRAIEIFASSAVA